MTEKERMALGGSQTVQQQPQAAASTGALAAPAMQTAQQQAATNQQISSAYTGLTGQPYSYNLDGDALYQQYRDRYTQNAKRAMQDTMGQAAALTGGYGSSYAQAVGQQSYDETMRGLGDLSYQMWRDRKTDAKQAYSDLSASILTAGYQPSDQELAAAGMTKEQAEALRQAWIAGNPAAAWMLGALTAEDYYKLTGKQPPAAPAAPGGGGGGYSGGGGDQTGGNDNGGTGGNNTGTGGGGSDAWSKYLNLIAPVVGAGAVAAYKKWK